MILHCLAICSVPCLEPELALGPFVSVSEQKAGGYTILQVCVSSGAAGDASGAAAGPPTARVRGPPHPTSFRRAPGTWHQYPVHYADVRDRSAAHPTPF